jgi:hypothetical protein
MHARTKKNPERSETGGPGSAFPTPGTKVSARERETKAMRGMINCEKRIGWARSRRRVEWQKLSHKCSLGNN